MVEEELCLVQVNLRLSVVVMHVLVPVSPEEDLLRPPIEQFMSRLVR